MNGASLFPAYIDAGTGSLVFQALIGGVLTVGYFATTQWRSLKMKVASLVRKNGASNEG